MDYLLSIYVPTYNRCQKVLRQVKFLLDEMKGFENKVELVVNNNCSTDATEAELEPFKGQIRYHKNSSNLGILGNLYALGELVHGKYIWIIGDDDFLNAGIVKHVITILEKYSDINLVFLNWANEGTERPKYIGEFGYFENAADMLTEDFMVRGVKLQFSSACIYKKKFWTITTEILPATDIRRYGCNLFAAMAAGCRGGIYLDGSIWIHNSVEISWKDIVNISIKGTTKGYERLVEVGYTKKQVKSLYQQYYTRDFLGRWISKENLNWKTVTACLSEMCFFFSKAPITVLKVIFQVMIYMIRE